MKPHLAELAEVSDISPILAVRALWPWEGDFESIDQEPALAVAAVDDSGSEQRCRGLYVAGSATPSLVARYAGDEVALTISGNVPPSVAAVLAVAGLGRKAEQRDDGLVLYRGDSEALWDRVLSIDAAWLLLRNLKRAESDCMKVAQSGARILEFARKWHSLRCDLVNHGDDDQRTAQREEMLTEASQAPGKWAIDGLMRLRILDDPRGSAVAIRCAGADHEYELPPIAMNWPIGTTHAAAPAPVKRERYAVIPTTVPDAVLGVLQGLVVAEKAIRITDKLPKKLYDQVNDVLTAMGGRWHTGKQVHVFDVDPAPELKTVCETGVIALPRDYEFFPTPAALVARVIEQAGLQAGMRVLEPSAGDGALAMGAAEIVGREMVTCYELMPRNVAALNSKGFLIDGPTDFLQTEPEPRFDAVILNPPFSGMRDVAHVIHALKFLKPQGRLVAIMSTHWQNVDTKPAQAFRATLASLGANVTAVPGGAFKESGTNVPTTMISLTAPAQVPQARVEAPATLQALLF
jgi:predicted RNA methylase